MRSGQREERDCEHEKKESGKTSSANSINLASRGAAVLRPYCGNLALRAARH
jgi:hypothetical protein